MLIEICSRGSATWRPRHCKVLLFASEAKAKLCRNMMKPRSQPLKAGHVGGAVYRLCRAPSRIRGRHRGRKLIIVSFTQKSNVFSYIGLLSNQHRDNVVSKSWRGLGPEGSSLRGEPESAEALQRLTVSNKCRRHYRLWGAYKKNVPCCSPNSIPSIPETCNQNKDPQ